MTTFLEYVCARLIGPPERTNGNGESFWPCPMCNHRSGHTRPHNPKYKDRFSCFRCDWYGDVYDILRHYRPQWNYDQQRYVLGKLWEDYAQGCALPEDFTRACVHTPSEEEPPTGALAIFLRGVHEGNTEGLEPNKLVERFSALTEEEVDTVFRAAVILKRVCPKDMYGLLKLTYLYVRDPLKWQTDGAHIKDCADPKCDWFICREFVRWEFQKAVKRILSKRGQQ